MPDAPKIGCSRKGVPCTEMRDGTRKCAATIACVATCAALSGQPLQWPVRCARTRGDEPNSSEPAHF